MAARRGKKKKADPSELLSSLERDDLPPVLAVGGPARVFVDDALEILRRRALEGAMVDFNHDRLDARTHGISHALNCARTLPVMATRRLVEVDRCDELREDAVAPLEAYLEAPCPESVLVFIFGAFDQRQKIPKLIASRVPSARFEHPREREMPGFVARRAQKFGLKLKPGVDEGIALTVGTDLGFLERALEKLVLATGTGDGKKGRAVTLADVSEHVADTHLEDAFAFVSSIARGDRKTALGQMASLQANRDPPLRLLGLVAWQLRQLVRARALLDEGTPESEVVRELKAWGERADALMIGARRFDMRGHERRLGRLALIDRKIKSSPAPDWRWIERMVFELCPPPPKKKRRAAS